MAKQDLEEKDRLTIYLPGDVAKRLKLLAVSRKRAASEIVAELLDRHLPHLEVRESGPKGKIPYA
jgi:predicted DNA-binding protein